MANSRLLTCRDTQDRRRSQRGGSVPSAGDRSTFQFGLCLSRGLGSADSHSSFYAETLSATSARAGQNLGRSTDSGGPHSGAAWDQTSRDAQSSILCPGDLRHRENRRLSARPLGLVPRNALVLTKPPHFAHLELDFVDCWERLGKELKVSKHQVNRTESTGHMSLVRAHNPKVVSSNLIPATMGAQEENPLSALFEMSVFRRPPIGGKPCP